jgi:DUF1365 family protein
MKSQAQMCFGRVMHQRLRPANHRFNYPVYFMRMPLHALNEISVPGFSVNRFNLLSFHESDHGDGGDVLIWARKLLSQHGIAADGDIWLTAFPRVLGYAFKPVSFWHCHDRAGVLLAVLAEVNNTFGERHVYLLRAPAVTGQPQRTEKVFHVSPFFPVRGHYTFNFKLSATHFGSRIDYDDGNGEVLRTAWWGKPEALTGAACLRAFFTYPMMTFAVIARIHVQALRLWLKHVPFFRKPPAPIVEVTE